MRINLRLQSWFSHMLSAIRCAFASRYAASQLLPFASIWVLPRSSNTVRRVVSPRSAPRVPMRAAAASLPAPWFALYNFHKGPGHRARWAFSGRRIVFVPCRPEGNSCGRDMVSSRLENVASPVDRSSLSNSCKHVRTNVAILSYLLQTRYGDA